MKVCSVCRRCYEDSALSCSEDNHDILTDARAGNCEVIPNYRLDLLEESDGAGETFRAVNTILNKPYLIKIIAPAAFDDAAKRRFLTETQGLAAIIHPNVARVFESGTLPDGSLYAVTEYLPAQNLRECFVNVGKPSEITALTILRQAAEGLEALHAANVMHRNIKPENIILTSDAENEFLIKLQNMDFGALRQRQVNQNGDLYLGDLRYFSPEQCASEDADAQSDIYALGVVLYEALAGKVPFDAAYADALIVKQTRENPPEIKINSFDIRMLLTHTLTDALQKTTRARLKTANAMTRRLRHIEQLATHSSTPPPAMAYPAAMNKTAVAFTPPAKNETPAKSETPLEAAPAIETAPVTENILLSEMPTIADNAASFETAAIIGNLPNTAPAINIEEVSATAPEAIAEELPVTEFQPVAETQPAIEVPAGVLETQPAVEIPSEVLSAIETHAIVEETPVVETPAIFEESPVFEAQAGFEPLPSFETAAAEGSVENETVAEEFVSTENEAAVDAPVLAESETFVENVVAAENEASAENAVETQSAAAEESLEEVPAEEVVKDYSTTKLPPIERILSSPAFKITEIETVFSLKRGNLDIHKTNEPALVEWEQPDDVPTITAALKLSKKNFADTQFVTNTDVIEKKAANADDDAEIEKADETETDEIEYVSEAHKTRRDYESVSSVFATYEDSGSRSWNLPGKRAIITAATICGLIVIAVGGVFLNRQMSSAGTETTAAKTSPTAAKNLPKPAEQQRSAETLPPAKPENVTVSSVENTSTNDLPNYEPRETTDVKTNVPVVQNNSKKRTPAKVSTTAKTEPQSSKPEANKVFDKQGNVKPDKKNASKNQASTSTKTDVFTRPRVVKNPKF